MPFLGGANSTFFSGQRKGSIVNPNVLPSLQIWYDAADSSVFTPSNPTDGSTITQWSDKSAFAHNANPSGGSTVRPTYKTNIQNGKSILRFDGTDDNLTINPASWAASLSGFTIYAVAKASSLSGTRSLIASDQGIKLFYDGSAWAIKDGGGTGTSPVAGDSTNFHVFGFIFDGSKPTNDERAIFRYDGSAKSLTFTGTVSSSTSSLTNAIDIGFYNSSEYFSGDVAEIIILSKALSGSDVASLEDYLSSKWAL